MSPTSSGTSSLTTSPTPPIPDVTLLHVLLRSTLWWLPPYVIVLALSGLILLAQQQSISFVAVLTVVGVASMTPGAVLVAVAAALSAVTRGKTWIVMLAWLLVWVTSPFFSAVASSFVLQLSSAGASMSANSSPFDVAAFSSAILVNTGPAAVLILLSVFFGGIIERRDARRTQPVSD